jgi:hypothetical protein
MEAGFASLVTVVSLLWATPASAFIFVVPSVSFPVTAGVGQTFGASVGLGNFSTPPESTNFPLLRFSAIDVVPACTNTALDCLGGVGPGVFALSPTGTGNPGSAPASCRGTWTITELSPGKFRFTPPGGEGSLLVATGEACVVNFTVTTLRVPTTDTQPSPGVQIYQLVSATAQDPGGQLPPVRNSSSDVTTVLQAPITIATVASYSSSTVSGTTTDFATLNAPSPPGEAPTGTITFNLYGSNSPTCDGAPAFTNTVPVNGTGTYASSPAPITGPGTYRWVATYSGDANYLPASGACNDPNETFVLDPAQPQIVTQATPTVPLGQSATDTATLSGAFNPTGTITFTVYGPNDATCVSPPAFTSTVPVAGNGAYTSAPFTITAPGTYRWVAAYSGDANNAPVVTSCNDPNETTVTIIVDPVFTTQATPSALVGNPVFDTATLSANNPGGTITFNLHGPGDPTCTGSPVFVSSVFVAGSGNYNSAPFTPAAPGTYRWVAIYSGDANNPAMTTACNDPNETTVVSPRTPALVTSATATATVGQPITDVATLSGGFNPTGTLTFRIYGPDDPTCSGPSGASVVVVSGNGNYSPGPFVPTRRGTYHWVVTYSGDPNNLAATSPCGAPGEVSVVGARPTGIAVFRGGSWLYRDGPTQQWGTPTDIAVPADYDGNGTSQDVAVFRPENGLWFIQGGATVHWGTTGDVPVPGDYDGNGADNIAVFRPSNGFWFIQGQPARQWGTNGDIPVPGDYDGNGTTDVAVFRPSNGVWHIQGGAAVAWGTSGDHPLPLPSAIRRAFFP